MRSVIPCVSARRVIAAAAWGGCHTAWGQALFTASEAMEHFLFLFLGPTNPRDSLEELHLLCCSDVLLQTNLVTIKPLYENHCVL